MMYMQLSSLLPFLTCIVEPVLPVLPVLCFMSDSCSLNDESIPVPSAEVCCTELLGLSFQTDSEFCFSCPTGEMC